MEKLKTKLFEVELDYRTTDNIIDTVTTIIEAKTNMSAHRKALKLKNEVLEVRFK